MRKRNIFISLFVAILLVATAYQAQALYGLEKFWGAVYDENGNVRTDVDTVSVYTVNTTTAATIYADDVATALTNPITTGLGDGVFEFYSATATFDVLIQAGSRAILLEDWTTSSKHQINITSQVSVGKSIRFSPGQFIAVNTGETAVVPLTTTSVPRLALHNNLVAIEWDDGDESYAQVTFKVPDDYLDGGSFKVLTDYDTGSAHPPIQFRVFVNSDSSAWDTAATAQTVVDPAGTAGTPELSTLTVTTDFASLAAGDVVTLQLTRDNDDASTAKLEIYYAEFYYNAKQ